MTHFGRFPSCLHSSLIRLPRRSGKRSGNDHSSSAVGSCLVDCFSNQTAGTSAAVRSDASKFFGPPTILDVIPRFSFCLYKSFFFLFLPSFLPSVLYFSAGNPRMKILSFSLSWRKPRRFLDSPPASYCSQSPGNCAGIASKLLAAPELKQDSLAPPFFVFRINISLHHHMR